MRRLLRALINKDVDPSLVMRKALHVATGFSRSHAGLKTGATFTAAMRMNMGSTLRDAKAC